jgi:hypothetical protein
LIFANGGFDFEKRGQPFIRTHSVTHSVAAMRVCDPDCSPVTVDPMGKSDSSVTFRGLRT